MFIVSGSGGKVGYYSYSRFWLFKSGTIKLYVIDGAPDSSNIKQNMNLLPILKVYYYLKDAASTSIYGIQEAQMVLS